MSRSNIINKSLSLWLLFFCFFFTEKPNKDPIVERIDEVPANVINKLDHLQKIEGKSLLEALQLVRQDLVPVGRVPQPWRMHVKENETDAMRSVIGTFRFRARIRVLQTDFDADFTRSMYIPEVDNITGETHHHREDHNHM